MGGRVEGLDLAGHPFKREGFSKRKIGEHLDLARNYLPDEKLSEDVFVQAFVDLDAAYKAHFSSSFRAKVRWAGDKAEAGWKWIQKGRQITGVVRQIGLAAEKSISPTVLKSFHQMRIVSIIALPSHLISLVQNIFGLSLSCFNQEKGKILIEKSLLIAGNLGDILDSIGTFLVGLKHFAVIAETSAAMAAATYLVGVSIIFSAAAILVQAKHWYETVQLKKKLLESLGKENNFQALFGKIEEIPAEKLAKRMGVSDGEELKARLQAVWKRSASMEGMEENPRKATEALKQRFFTKELSHALKIVAAVIGIIGGIMAFTPAAPAGFALLATAAILGIGLEIFDFASEQYLLYALRQMAPDDCKELIAYRVHRQLAPYLTVLGNLLKKEEEMKEEKEEPMISTPLKPRVGMAAEDRKKFVNWQPGHRQPKKDAA